jgi:B9 domain-containing protein 2
MAEVHIIGQVSGANNFPKSELSCKWEFVVGKDWNHVQGEDRGQTHVDLPLVRDFNLGRRKCSLGASS